MLLDTHVLLWLLADDPAFGPVARGAVAASAAVHVSSASIWEIAIKSELGKLDVPDDLLDRVDDAGVRILPVTPRHAWATRPVAGLAHRDPFDRLLVAQAASEHIALLTADRALLDADIRPRLTVLDARA